MKKSMLLTVVLGLLIVAVVVASGCSREKGREMTAGQVDEKAAAGADNTAQSVGLEFKAAQDDFFLENQRHATNLQELLAFDSMLSAEPDVTFVFGPANASGYTFTTRHAKGSGKTFEFRKN